MPNRIPVASLNAASSQTITIDETVYRLTFNFNVRCQLWSMTIAEQDGTPIVSGIALLPQVDLLERHRDERLPRGRLFALDVLEGNRASRPTRNDLNTKLVLVYLTEEEVDDFI